MASSSMLPTLISWKGSSNWISRKAGAVGSSISISRKAAAGSSICISRKGAAAGSSICISRKDAAARSSVSISRKAATNLFSTGGARINTMSVSDDESSALCRSRSLPSRISPWLMLPPAFEGGNMVYKFYSLAENRVLSFNKRGGGGDGEEELELELPANDAQLVGLSHGWLASFNRRNGDLFLSNPISRRHIKLPSIHTLPMEDFLRRGSGYSCVTNVIISCSPDEEECRAMMIYSPQHRLAFCCPRRSTEWIPIGELYHVLDDDDRTSRSYEACVYSSSQKLFYCTTRHEGFEAWDLEDPLSPRMIPLDDVWVVEEKEEEKWERMKEYCLESKSLVVLEQSNELLHVTQFTMDRMGPDGSHVEAIYYSGNIGSDTSVPYKPIDFDVHKYDWEGRAFERISSLDGVALFIGLNHSFALSAREFPELKPNTIYFTDVYRRWDPDLNYGGHDMGIFHYENRTLSSCYYPCDYQSIKRIVPSPMWFTPDPF